MVRVMLCDNQPLDRARMRRILSDDPATVVVAEVTDEAQAVHTARRLQVDVVFTEINLTEANGFRIATQLARSPGVARVEVAVLARSPDIGQAMSALRAGDRGFLLRSDPPNELSAAPRLVKAGYIVLSPTVVRDVVDDLLYRAAPRTAVPVGFSALTGRERQIYHLLVAGLSNGEIAGRLVVGQATVKSHVSRLLAKLGLHNRSELIANAYRMGFTSQPSRDTDG